MSIHKQSQKRAQINPATPRRRTLVLESLEGRFCPASSVTPQISQLALAFEQNLGQSDSQVDYLARGGGYTVFLAHGDAVVDVAAAGGLEGGSVRLHLVDASSGLNAVGVNALPGRSNYLTGSDESKWVTDVPQYSAVSYPNAYPGINLSYHGAPGTQLEYDFDVKAGSDPSRISIEAQGADSLAIDALGRLVIGIGGQTIEQPAPVVYQDGPTGRQIVDGRYVLQAGDRFGFELGAYDPTRDLVIDPVLNYSSYLGGFGVERINAVTIDADGNLYATGLTTSADFLFASDPVQRIGVNPAVNAFVTKIDPTGKKIVFTTFLSGDNPSGGFFLNEGRAIAVGKDGLIYLTGYTESSTFPIVHPYPNGDKLGGALSSLVPFGGDAFVSALFPSGSALKFSAYLGGSEGDRGNAIAVNDDGDIFVGGSTMSHDVVATPGDESFPIINAIQPTYGGGTGGHDYTDLFDGDGFVAKFHFGASAQGSKALKIDYSTFLGGSQADVVNAIALDDSGNLVITGFTASANGQTTPNSTVTPFPVSGAFQPDNNSVHATLPNPIFAPLVNDAFVTKLEPDGGLLFSSYLGGGGNDFGNAVAVEPGGVIDVVGETDSVADPAINEKPFPIPPGTPLQNQLAGGKTRPFTANSDAFLARIDADGKGVFYATYFGGTDYEVAHSVVVDAAGDLYIGGTTYSADLKTEAPIQAAFGGSPQEDGLNTHGDAFLAKLHFRQPTVAQLAYSTYLGGFGDDQALALAVGGDGAVTIAGATNSDDFQPKNALDDIFGGGSEFFPIGDGDGFFAKISSDPLRVLGIPFAATRAQRFSGAVATFLQPDPDRPLSDFRVTINWGDGASGPGALAPSGTTPGSYDVIGNHTYIKAGSFPVVVSVQDAVNDAANANPITAVTNVTRRDGNQNEPNIAVNPQDPNQLFAASNAEHAGSGGITGSYSADGGRHWNSRIIAADGSDGLPAAIGDPQAAFDDFGTLYVTYVDASDLNVVVILSVNGGQTFAPLESFPSLVSGGNVDQPSIATGPGDDADSRSVWVSYLDVSANQIMVAGAKILGPNSFEPFAKQAAPDSKNGNFGSIAVGPKGQVLVVWQDNASGVVNVYGAIDPDGLGKDPIKPSSPPPAPNTASIITSTNFGSENIPPSPGRLIDAEPNLAWDRTNGPHPNRVYLSYTDSLAPNSGTTIIQLRFSDDDGATWSNPVRVDDSDGKSDLFLPAIAFDAATGDVAVSWYDTRGDSSNKTTRYSVAISGDGGQTFSPSTPLTAGRSDATDSKLNTFGKNNRYGDYTGLVFEKGLLYPVWTDNSQSLTDNPNPPQFEIATGVFGIAYVKDAPVTVVALPVNAVEGVPFSGLVAFVTDADPNLDAADFTAFIDWGDGESSPGSVSPGGGPSGGLKITGGHTYGTFGKFPIVVTLHDLKRTTFVTTSYDVSQIEANQFGPAIAVDPANPQLVFAVSSHETLTGLFASFSTDGGVTWTPVDASDHTIADGGDGLPQASGSPSVAFDPFGRLFLTYLDQKQQSIIVVRSDNGGQSFDPDTVDTLPSPGGDPTKPSIGRPLIAIGPADKNGVSSVWLAAQDLNDQSINMLSASSTADGVGPFDVGDTVPESMGALQLGSLTVGPEGTPLVAFQRPTAGGSEIVTSVDLDGRGPLEATLPTLLRPITRSFGDTAPALDPLPLGASVRVVWDYSNGPHQGRVYAVWTDGNPDDPHSRLTLASSDDLGRTWSIPSVVDDESSGHDQFLPSLAVDQTTGDVAMAWYDTRDSLDNTTARVYISITSNGGENDSPPVAVSLGQINAQDGKLSDVGTAMKLGDVTGLYFQDGVVTAIWTDNSPNLSLNPDLPNFDVADAVINVANVVDAPLTAAGLTINAAKGKEFNETLATFTDPNMFSNLSHFTATIDWKDGTVDPGFLAESNGGFEVQGTHTYTQGGNHSPHITIKDYGGSRADVDALVKIDAAVIVQALDASGYVDRTFDGKLASFADVDKSLQIEDFTATIDWGDGTTTSGLPALENGGFEVDGSHSYSQKGVYAVTVSVRDKNGDSNDDVGNLSIVQELHATGRDVSVAAGETFLGAIGSFTDADPQATLADYAITVDWGDGSVTSAAPVPTGSSYDISGAHTYAQSGSYQIQITVTRFDGPKATASGSATVTFTPFVPAIKANLSAFQNVTTGTVDLVAFDLKGPAAPASDYSATIDWGDGAPIDAGAINLLGTTVTVSGSHTYPNPGSFHPQVFIQDKTGDSGAASASIDIAGDVSNLVVTIGSGLVYNPATQLYYGDIVVTNTSQSVIQGPSIEVVLTGLPNGVVVTNATGTTGAGDPFLGKNVAKLAPGAALPPIAVVFQIQASPSFSYTIKTYSDPPDWPLATGNTLFGEAGTPISDLVASFLGADAQDVASDYFATVDWGDGAASAPAAVVADPAVAGQFLVNSSHTYVTSGHYDTTVTIHRTLGGDAIAKGSSEVARAPLSVTGLTIGATAGESFSATVARFTNPNITEPPSSLTATIDWGDGTPASPGQVGIDNQGPSLFAVTGTHIYARAGKFPIKVLISDSAGGVTPINTTGSATTNPLVYHVVVDASAAGAVHFQFDPGATPGAQAATATISHFDRINSLVGSASTHGAVSGSLSDQLLIANSSLLNDFTQTVTGGVFQFDVTLSGPAVTAPDGELFGSRFSVQLLAADGVTPLSTTDASGSVIRIDLNPDGSSTSRVSPASQGHDSVASGSSSGFAKVADSPVTAKGRDISATEGAPFDGVVATFTTSSTAAAASDYSVAIDWGDGSTPSTGTVAADAPGSFVVSGHHIYAHPGQHPLVVSIHSPGGGVTTTAGAPKLVGARNFSVGDYVPGQSLSAPQGVAIGDFNSDGIPDLAVADIRGSAAPFTGSVAILIGRGDGAYLPFTKIDAGRSPAAIVAADFNGDGKIDLAIADAGDPSGAPDTPAAGAAVILLGIGDGTFEAPASYAAGPGPDAIAMGDLNNDGKFDLAVVDSRDNVVNLLTNNGDGSFILAGVVRTDPSATGAVIADLNDDGKADLAVSARDLDVFLGKGDGTFNNAPFVYGATSSPSSVAAGDFNGDGRLDLVVGDQTPDGTVAMFQGKGDGTFAAPRFLNAGSAPVFVSAADLNSDGKLDLAVADAGVLSGVSLGQNGGASVLLGHGDGTFDPALTSTTGWEPLALAVGDLQNDGKPDLVIVDSQDDYVTVLLGRGNGMFEGATSVADTEISQTIASGDFNGDGKPDLVVGDVPPISARLVDDGRLSILLGAGDGSFQSAQIIDAGAQPSSIAVGDVNGDGKLDLVVALAGGTSADPFGGVAILLGRGDGTFPNVTKLAAGLRPIAVVLGDVNGDGKLDVLSADEAGGDVSVLIGHGDGTFDRATHVLTGGLPKALAAADLDGDGKLDIVVSDFGGYNLLHFQASTSRVFVIKGHGDGTFDSPVSYITAFGARTVGIADLNGDGKLDIAVGCEGAPSPSSGAISVLLGVGDGTFEVHRDTLAGPINSLLLRDFNGDGKTDLAYSVTNDSHATLLLAKGDGTFQTPQSVALGAGVLTSIAATDFDGDGRLDLAASTAGYSHESTVLGKGDGSFSPPLFANQIGQPFRMVAGDFNDDGKADLAMTDLVGAGLGAAFHSGIQVLIGRGDGTNLDPVTYEVSGTNLAIAQADVNGDGKSDLIVSSQGTFDFGSLSVLGSAVSVFLGIGDGAFSAAISTPVATLPRAITVGDFDGDGKLDIALANDGTPLHNDFGSLTVLYGKGDGTLRAAVKIASNIYDDLVAVDVNGDGKSDLAAPNAETATVELFVGSSTGSFQAVAGLAVGQAPVKIATADLNGDGKLDLIVGAPDKLGVLDVLLGNGDGTFVRQVDNPIVGRPAGIAIADLNADGKLDIAVAHSDRSGVSVLYGLGDGTFLAAAEFVTGRGSNNVVATDVNDDGLPDLAVVNFLDNTVTTLLERPTSRVATVTPAPIVAAGEDIQAQVNVAFSGVVATFDYASSLATAADITATITWGDGHTSAGVVSARATGGFVVTGANTFASTGTFPVHVLLQAKSGTSASANSSANVTTNAPPAPIVVTANAITARLGESTGDIVVGQFVDPASAPASSYTATIDWGDATPQTSGAVIATAGGFQVLGSHAYSHVGGFVTTIAIHEGAGRSATASGAANVTTTAVVPHVISTGLPISATAGVGFTANVATFTDTDSHATASQFTAKIDWGDGSSSLGAIVADQTHFDVLGSHAYDAPGLFTTAIHIVGPNLQSTDAHGSAQVESSPITYVGPSVISLKRFGIHAQPTRLVVAFDGAIDPAVAGNLANYQVIGRGRDGRLGTRDDEIIAIDRADYDPFAHSVTLLPHRRLNFHHNFLLKLVGTGPQGLAGPSGQKLHGGDQTIKLGPKNLVPPGPLHSSSKKHSEIIARSSAHLAKRDSTPQPSHRAPHSSRR
jgi:FG-GAP-like repeat